MRENTRAWRIRETLRDRAPAPVLSAYRRWVAPRITDAKDHVRFSSWARTGRGLREEFGTARIGFEDDGIWITDAEGFDWCYEPDVWQSALGREVGWQHDPAEVRHVVASVGAGGTYVDVGAHVGGFAIPVARAHPDATLHLIEPAPGTRTLLTKNLARNGVADRVTVWDCAVGAEAHVSAMSSADGMGNHLASSGTGSVEVQVETLDGLLLARVARVDVIKCDVEGGELPAMRGAEQLLRRDHPDVVLEIDRRFTPRFGYQPEELFEFFSRLGYVWKWFDGEVLRDGVDIEHALENTNNFLFTQTPEGR